MRGRLVRVDAVAAIHRGGDGVLEAEGAAHARADGGIECEMRAADPALTWEFRVERVGDAHERALARRVRADLHDQRRAVPQPCERLPSLRIGVQACAPVADVGAGRIHRRRRRGHGRRRCLHPVPHEDEAGGVGPQRRAIAHVAGRRVVVIAVDAVRDNFAIGQAANAVVDRQLRAACAVQVDAAVEEAVRAEQVMPALHRNQRFDEGVRVGDLAIVLVLERIAEARRGDRHGRARRIHLLRIPEVGGALHAPDLRALGPSERSESRRRWRSRSTR